MEDKSFRGDDTNGDKQPIETPEEGLLSLSLPNEANTDGSRSQEVPVERGDQKKEPRVEVSIKHDQEPQVEGQPISPIETAPDYGYAGRNEQELKSEIHRLRKRVEEQETVARRIDQQAKEANEQLNVVRSQQEAFEKTLEKKDLPAKESNQSAQEVLTPERPPEFVVDSSDNPKPPESPRSSIEAIDTGAPIEREFELRHEVKDKPSGDGSLYGATPISAILQSTTQQNHLQTSYTPTPNQTIRKANRIGIRTIKIPTPTYSQAISGGFMAGLAISVATLVVGVIF